MKNHFLRSATLSALLLSPLLFSATKAQADGVTDNGFGVGFILGAPSGLSASLPMGPGNAVNFLLGYDLSRDANITLLGDYVWRRSDLIPVEIGKVSLYYGPGGRVMLADQTEAGIRAVLGIDYIFQDSPIQALFEVCPGVNIVPNTRTSVTGGIGLRYFF